MIHGVLNHGCDAKSIQANGKVGTTYSYTVAEGGGGDYCYSSGV
jgi:hypothetical protein